MNNFKLNPGDILVNIDTGKSPFAIIKRWALSSPFSHIFMYMGPMAILVDSVVLRHPMLFESNGRGVVLQSLSNRFTQKVVVMRLKAEHDRKRIPRVLEEAIKLASDSQSYYDYLCIVRFAIPRLIFEKLGLPMPLKYHRDPWHICSEAVGEVFIRGGLDLLYLEDVPLPGDFVTESIIVEKVWAGSLSEELV